MKNTIKIVLKFATIKILYLIVASFLLNCIDSNIINNQTDGLNNIEIFILSIFISPLLETVISQLFLYYIPLKAFNFNEKFCFHLASIFFGIMHYYNPLFILFTIPSGYIYMFFYKRLLSNVYVAFFSVVFVHSLSNLFSFISNLI